MTCVASALTCIMRLKLNMECSGVDLDHTGCKVTTICTNMCMYVLACVHIDEIDLSTRQSEALHVAW